MRIDPDARPESDVAFDHEIPRPGPAVFVLRLKGGEMYTLTIYSTAMWGLWVHFIGKRSSPHFRNPARCEGCKIGQGKRWKGYLHCFCHELKQEVFLELTPGGAQSLARQLATSGPLRGNRVQVKRTKGDQGRLQVSVLTATGDPRQLPEPRDPWQTLRVFYGFDPAQLGDPAYDLPAAAKTEFE